jgi:hypothetical protein
MMIGVISPSSPDVLALREAQGSRAGSARPARREPHPHPLRTEHTFRLSCGKIVTKHREKTLGGYGMITSGPKAAA